MTVNAISSESLVESDLEKEAEVDHQLSISDGPSLSALKKEEEVTEGQNRVELDECEVRSILEAVLFVSHEPITVEKLVTVLDGVEKSQVVHMLRVMQEEYEQEGRGLRLSEVAGGFLLTSKPEYGTYMRRLGKVRSASKLSRSALETLAIIGYKQPITRLDIEKIRGVETSGVLRTLLDQKLVRIVGRQDVPGRPILYGTSKQFLQRFGLRDLRDLPPLKEIEDLGIPGTLDLPFDGERPSDEAALANGRIDLPA
ncbi:MAG: SMC-Scp complex subunit ScpB [Nitrospirales bacterium]|nr:SMC-Scp complex subunit ScpB [Nitrospira sp.]MDR4503048.1 SMC-Scp complex subunit ScpB [Nitrospirales bacterium]